MTESPQAAFDARVRRHIYETIIETGAPPSVAATGGALDAAEPDIVKAYRRLHDAHTIVLANDALDIRMAPPFAAWRTPFTVHSGNRTYYANCAWDALGVAATLQRDAVMRTACPDCDEPIRIAVVNGAVPAEGYMVHIAVPAAAWWKDIVFT